MASSTSTLVCVTGASGFIGSQLVKDLLEKNYRVRATVRSLAKTESYKHLQGFAGAQKNLEVVEANNEDEESFKKSFTGCETVHHTASPFFHPSTPELAQKLVVEPAIAGVVNALKAAVAVGVKKVVVTSSMATVCGSQRATNPNHVWTEADWNDVTTPSYQFSKLAAERAAWDFAKAHPELKVVTINPCYVMGPVYSNYNATSTSVGFLVKFFDGSCADGVKQFLSGFVDVRTVSQAHICAQEKPNANGRYLCCNTSQGSELQVAQFLSEEFPQYQIPNKLKAGEVLKEPLVNSTDHTKAEKELGVHFIDLKKTIVDMAHSLIQHGIVVPKKKD